MITRSILAILFLCTLLPGQNRPEGAALPTLPEVPQAPKILELRDYHDHFKGVVVHRMDVKPGATLVMKNLSGDVVLLGTDVHRIVVEEKITVKTHNEARAREIIEETRGALSEVEKDRTYSFQAKRWGGWEVSSDYKIRVPTTFSVIVETYGGDIDLADLTGDLEAKTGGGDIALSGIQGRILIKTGGGDIDAFKTAGQMELITGGGDIEGRAIQGKVSVMTGGGDIEFWNSKGSLSINTGGGSIEIQNFEGSEIEARTGGGDIVVEDITGNINVLTKGGDVCTHRIWGDAEVATSGGDLCLEDARGDAIMFTGSGDADISRISGALSVKCGDGDIYVESMTLTEPGKKESSLITGHGDVYVELETNEQVDITARIVGYPPRLAVQLIDSDVDLDYSVENGNTIATYRSDNPYHSIQIETSDGEIEIISGD